MKSFSSRRTGAARVFVRLVFVLLSSSLVAACGGGGGGSSTPAGTFTLAANTAAFPALRNAAAPASRSIALTVTGSKVAFVGAAYENGQAQPSWLGIDVTGSGNNYTLVLTILTTSLAPAQYSTTFAVGTADANGNVLQKQSVTVTYTVTAGITLSAAPLSSSFIYGDTRSTETLNISVQAAERQWALASNAAWLQVPTATQTGNASLIGTIDVGNLSPGSYTGTVRATNAANSADTTSFNVSVVVTPAAFTVVEDSVLLGGADGRSDTLQQAVYFSLATGNGLHPYTVTLTTDDGGPWLSADSSGGMVGSGGGMVTLTANPTGLATDQTHFADVTITSPDADVENEQSVRVGLHLASSTPVTTISAADTVFLAASPVEPLVATNDGVGSSVELRNFHTGELVRTLSNVVAQAGGMTWSGDGRTLYVHDTTNLRVVALSPETGAQSANYDATPAQSGGAVGRALAYLRPAGFPMLVTPGSRLFDLDTGTERSDPAFTIASSAVSLAVSPDQSLIVPDFGSVKRLERSALNGGSLQVSDGTSVGTAQGRAGEACVSAAGARVYTASGAPYEFPATSLATGAVVQRLPGSNYPNSIQCVWNGLVVGGIDGFYAEKDIWVYDGPTGVNLAQFSSSPSAGYRSLVDRGLAVSADGTRLVSAARESGSPGSHLYFQTLPSPP